MRLPFAMLITLILISVLVDLLIYRDLKKYCSSRPICSKIHAVAAIACWVLLISISLIPLKNAHLDLQWVMWILYGYISIYVSKIFYSVISIFGKIPMLWKGGEWPLGKYLGFPIGVLVFVAVWWGALVTRHEIEVVEQPVCSQRLPESFDGYKIVHISDMHLGTWCEDTTFISKMVNRINELKPDMILFTGDIVNRSTPEIYPFVSVLSRLSAKDGVYSVLGNHDYGDYMHWQSETDRANNNRKLAEIQASMGWQLLNNENRIIRNSTDSIVLIGVENWGEPPFKQYGDFKASYPDLNDNNFKILMSHNPEHWRREVSKTSNVDLTLSGHTHGMQIVLQIGDWRWSPAVWKYEEWGGLYSKQTPSGDISQIYVNIGLGEVALPFRLGATPEVTLIRLCRE